jgi:sugar-specific transcriptional regulator TrmB
VVYTDGSCLRVPEIAEKMAIKQNYLYGVLPGLAEDGLVEKDDQARTRRARHLRTHNLGGRVPESTSARVSRSLSGTRKRAQRMRPTPPARPTAER